jgi:hypothetical protein
MASTYLSRTPSSNGNQKIWTFSGWVKRSNLSSYQYLLSAYYGGSDRYTTINFENDDKLLIYGGVYTTGASTTVSFNKKTSQVFRDVSAWYHIVISVDTTLATASDRIKIYVNGNQITSFDTDTNPSQNDDTFFNVTTTGNQVGAINSGSYFDGSMAHAHFIDGTAYDASAFGETDSTTGIWKAKTAPSVTYGTNGFFLKFENSGAFGTDSSPNGNNFTVNGTMTQTIDTPSNVFATMNPLASQAGSSASSTTNTFSNGNLTVTDTISETAIANLGVSQGKWFWEVKVITDQDGLTIGGANEYYHLDAELGYNSPSSPSNAKVFGYYGGSGNKFITVGDGSQFTSYGSAIAVNNIVGVAMNLDDNEVTFYLNGSSQGTFSITALGSGEVYFPAVGNWSGGTITVSFNFGNGYFGTTAVSSVENPDDGIGIFEYDVPTGYKALCTKSINAQEYS